MDQVSAMLHLGGYGMYVWPAYGVAAIVLIGLLWRTLASLRANERLVTQLQNLPQNRPQTLPRGGDAAGTPAGAERGTARHEPAR